MVPAIAINDVESKFWMRCSNKACRTFIDTYIPLDHQSRIHSDNHRYIGVFGGYGSGKTQCTLKDDEKHMLITPNGTTVVGSAVLAQVEETWEKDFRNDFPKEFIASKNEQKKRYQLVNGHTLLVKSYYDEELLRSLNASRIHIVEASAVGYEIYTQLKTRLRNDAGTLPLLDEEGKPVLLSSFSKAGSNSDSETESGFAVAADWRKGLIESNPSAGWIRDDFLLLSSHIDTNGSKYQYAALDNPDPNNSSYVIPTKANKYLPPTFYEDNARNKPAWWINRYLNGSFDYAEGLVYPNIFGTFINSFEVPDTWVRLMAMDYGIRDPSAFIFGAIDTENGMLYIIGEIYVNNMNVKSLADEYYKQAYLYTTNPYKLPVMDGKSINKRNDLDLRTIGDLFKDEGIWFEPAQMALDARMTRLNELVESGKIKIFRDKCPNLYREIMDYKFPERNSDNTLKAGGDKPVDKNNHAVNALEFLAMEVPKDMHNLKCLAYDGFGRIISHVRKSSNNTSRYNPYALPTSKNTYPQREDIFIGTGGNSEIPW